MIEFDNLETGYQKGQFNHEPTSKKEKKRGKIKRVRRRKEEEEEYNPQGGEGNNLCRLSSIA